MRLAFKWLSNILVSDRNSFKEVYLTTFNNEKYTAFKEIIRQKIVSELFQDLLHYVNLKVTLYLAPISYYVFMNQPTIIDEYWRKVLKVDLQLSDVDVQCDDSTSTCYDCILKELFSPVWNQSTLDKIANTIANCVANGSSLNRDKVSIFSLIHTIGDRPSDFAIANIHDYWGAWLSLSSYLTSLATYPILAFMDDYIQTIQEECDDSWSKFAKILINSKTTTNVYDENLVDKYAFIKWLFKQRIKHLNYYFDVLTDDQPWNYAYVIKIAYEKLIQDLAKTLIESDQSLSDVVKTYDFESKLDYFISEIKGVVEFEFKRFDKTRIQKYFDDVINNSDDSSHIHPGLYPVFEFICQGQDIQSKDHLCTTYNAIKAIQTLSNFDKVNLDDYVSETLEKNLDIQKISEWSQYIKNDCLNYIDNYLSDDVLSLQKEEWFYETYVITYKIVTDCLNSSYNVLIEPLLAELRDKYNFAAIEEFQQAVNAQVYVNLISQTSSSLQTIISIFFEEREKIDLSVAIDDLITGNSYKLTSQLQQLVSNALSRYKEFVNLDSAKYSIKDAIVNLLYNYAGSSQLKFDVLAGNLDFLVNYDTYYGQFETAFENKLYYEIKKFYHNIEHSFIGTFYKKLCEIDAYSYLIYPLIDFSKEFKLLEYILLGLLFLDVVRYNAIDVMEFPISLVTNYQLTNEIMMSLMDNDTYKALVCTSFES